MKIDDKNMEFVTRTPEEMNISNVPRGYSLLVWKKADESFAQELINDNDIILRFVNLEAGQNKSDDGDHSMRSYLVELIWKLANV